LKDGVLAKITTYIYDGTTDEVGSLSILMYTNKKQACIVRTIKNMILEFKNVDWNIAVLEGEDNNLREWQDEHFVFFKPLDNNFNDKTKVVIELFEVTKKY
jgi:uncharacterized protein YhfF